MLKPDALYISFYGWSHVVTFMSAWKQAGFRPVGHFVWLKSYASRTGFLQYRHEQAYLLAKGNPPRPDNLLSDVQPWTYSGNRYHPTGKAVSIIDAFNQGVLQVQRDRARSFPRFRNDRPRRTALRPALHRH